MPEDSPRRLIIMAILACIAAVVSYARGYFEAQNSKKLERDAAEAENKKTKKLLNYILEKEQEINDTLWGGQTLLLVFQALVFGALCHDVIDELKTGLSGAAGYFMNFGIYLCGGLIFVFLYVVLVRRLFAAFGTSKGRKTEKYRSLRLVRFLYFVFLPFSGVCGFVTKSFVRMLGLEQTVLDENVTEDEILTLVDMGEENGVIESGEKEMIENVLDFTDVTAGELLTHRTALTAVPIDISEKDLLAVIRETGYSRLPVYEGDVDSIVGILSTKLYLLDRFEKNGEKKPLKDLLYPPHFVPESVHASNLLSDMKKNKVHMAVVVDEYGGTAGIITMEDLLEEIVGSIYDETDDPASDDGDIVRLEDNLWRVKGSTELEKLFEELDVVPPEEPDFDTLAGLVFSCLDLIPEDGEKPEVEKYGLHVKVEKIAERRVVSALVSKLPEAGEEEE